eukprot:Sdes_comp10935_c0_seq1m2580
MKGQKTKKYFISQVDDDEEESGNAEFSAESLDLTSKSSPLNGRKSNCNWVGLLLAALILLSIIAASIYFIVYYSTTDNQGQTTDDWDTICMQLKNGTPCLVA